MGFLFGGIDLDPLFLGLEHSFSLGFVFFQIRAEAIGHLIRSQSALLGDKFPSEGVFASESGVSVLLGELKGHGKGGRGSQAGLTGQLALVGDRLQGKGVGVDFWVLVNILDDLLLGLVRLRGSYCHGLVRGH